MLWFGSLVLVSLFYVTQALCLSTATAFFSSTPEDSLFTAMEPLLRWQLGLPQESSLPPYSPNRWWNLVQEATTWTMPCPPDSDSPEFDLNSYWNLIPEDAAAEPLDDITMALFIGEFSGLLAHWLLTDYNLNLFGVWCLFISCSIPVTIFALPFRDVILRVALSIVAAPLNAITSAVSTLWANPWGTIQYLTHSVGQRLFFNHWVGVWKLWLGLVRGVLALRSHFTFGFNLGIAICMRIVDNPGPWPYLVGYLMGIGFAPYIDPLNYIQLYHRAPPLSPILEPYLLDYLDWSLVESAELPKDSSDDEMVDNPEEKKKKKRPGSVSHQDGNRHVKLIIALGLALFFIL